MLDTAKLSTYRPLLPNVAEDISRGISEPVPDWHFRIYRPKPNPSRSSDLKLEGWNEQTGMYVSGTPVAILGYSCSLPRVLNGYNGLQLKSTADIGKSIDKAHSILDEVSTDSNALENFRRLDVAFNLDHPEPERVVLALRNASHPWIRREKEHYAVGSIRYPGTEVVFQAYWKLPPQKGAGKRKAWKTPGVLRIEVQLKKPGKIAEFLGAPLPPLPRIPDYRALYLALRQFMLMFPRREQLAIPCGMPALLALCEANDLRLPGGENVMDWHRRSVGASGHKKMCGKVAAFSAQFLSIDWEQLLPAHQVPSTLDVHLDDSTTYVPAIQLSSDPMKQASAVIVEEMSAHPVWSQS